MTDVRSGVRMYASSLGSRTAAVYPRGTSADYPWLSLDQIFEGVWDSGNVTSPGTTGFCVHGVLVLAVLVS